MCQTHIMRHFLLFTEVGGLHFSSPPTWKCMLDRVVIRGGSYSSLYNAAFVLRHVERTGENTETDYCTPPRVYTWQVQEHFIWLHDINCMNKTATQPHAHSLLPVTDWCSSSDCWHLWQLLSRYLFMWGHHLHTLPLSYSLSAGKPAVTSTHERTAQRDKVIGDSAENGSTCVVTDPCATVKDKLHHAENKQQKSNYGEGSTTVKSQHVTQKHSRFNS